MKINIFQPDIRSYRVPVFNSLAALPVVDLTVTYGWGEDASPCNSNYSSRFKKAYRAWGFYFQFGIAKSFKGAEVNIVPFDIHWITVIFWAFWFRKSSKFILWGHGLGRSRFAAKIKVWLASKAHSVIVYSSRGRLELIQAGVSADKVVVAVNTIFIPNSNDSSKCEKEYFLYVGRLQARKELDSLINAFAFYREKLDGHYKLLIVGDGDGILEGLKRIVKENNLSHLVTFLSGTVDNDELISYFSKAVAYASPGAVGLGVLHAFSYGVPVITVGDRKHGPEVEWVKSSVNGFVSEVGTEEFAKTMKMFEEPALAEALGRNAFDTYNMEASHEVMLSGFKRAIYG